VDVEYVALDIQSAYCTSNPLNSKSWHLAPELSLAIARLQLKLSLFVRLIDTEPTSIVRTVNTVTACVSA
jgi:hypothetical protein